MFLLTYHYIGMVKIFEKNCIIASRIRQCALLFLPEKFFDNKVIKYLGCTTQFYFYNLNNFSSYKLFV